MPKNNVNPGLYKVAGSLRQGEAIVHDRNKQAFSTQEQGRDRRRRFRLPRRPLAALQQEVAASGKRKPATTRKRTGGRTKPASARATTARRGRGTRGSSKTTARRTKRPAARVVSKGRRRPSTGRASSRGRKPTRGRATARRKA